MSKSKGFKDIHNLPITLSMGVMMIDQPTRVTGRIYPLVSMEPAIEEYNKQSMRYGYMYSEYDYSNSYSITSDLSRISHRIDDVWLDKITPSKIVLNVKFTTLSTPHGIILRDLLNDTEIKYRLSPNVLGKIDYKTDIVDVTTIHGFDIIFNTDDDEI